MVPCSTGPTLVGLMDLFLLADLIGGNNEAKKFPPVLRKF